MIAGANFEFVGLRPLNWLFVGGFSGIPGLLGAASLPDAYRLTSIRLAQASVFHMMARLWFPSQCSSVSA